MGEGRGVLIQSEALILNFGQQEGRLLEGGANLKIYGNDFLKWVLLSCCIG